MTPPVVVRGAWAFTEIAQVAPALIVPIAFEFRVAAGGESIQLSGSFPGGEYRQAAIFNIRNLNVIETWEQAYETGGVTALVPYKPGRRRTMKKPTRRLNSKCPAKAV